jgi:hypothetical protein
VARRIAQIFRAPSEYSGYERRFQQLKRQHAHVLGERLNNRHLRQRVALVCCPGFPEVEIELGLIKGLQLSNFSPVVLIPDLWDYRELLAGYYRLAAVDEIHQWGEFIGKSDSAIAESLVSRCKTVWDLVEFEHAGIGVGRIAVSTALRSTYRGSLDLEVPEDRQFLVDAVTRSMAAAGAAQKIVRQFRPDLALFVDTVYSPTGELFECCLQNDVDCVMWQAAHKSNALNFKRYNFGTRHEHPNSLSPESWQFVREMEWTEDHRRQLDRELYSTYASGDWYSVVGTQFNKSIVDSRNLRERFGLDAKKKTAIIYPHILWDATLFWGECLFSNFEEWLVETVRAACANDQVNWVIKIHPGNQRLREEGTMKESAEVEALCKYIGKLPPHIIMIPCSSEVSTYSTFQIADYCLTGWGTVGMEAARLGIPVLTGGRGFYDRRGFTVDSNTGEEYIEKLRKIQAIPRLSSAQQELAERFAYATFLLRPWQVKSVTLRYLPNKKKFLYQGQINIKSREGWYAADDIKAFAEFIASPIKLDEYLAQPMPPAIGTTG